MTDIKTSTFDEIVKSVVKAQEIIEETEAGIKVLKDELGDRLRSEKLSGKKSGNFYVNRVKRISTTDVDISTARELGCVKEALDANKIKALVDRGVKVLGAKFTEYINIREEKQSES